MTQRTIIFLFINFAALGIGSWLMDNGPSSNWYLQVNKAPWTPPGWVFGAAWFSIMLLFSFYMATLMGKTSDRQTLLLLFGLQWILNVGWNPVFFKYHQTLAALIVIVSLTFLVFLILYKYRSEMNWLSLLLLPYGLWLIVATSLNSYIHFNN